MKNLYYRLFALTIIFTALTTSFTSCSNKEKIFENNTDSIPEGYAALNIQMVDIQFEEDNLTNITKKTASSSINKLQNDHKLDYTGMTCVASLEPENAIGNNLGVVNKTSAVQHKPIEAGIRYRVYAYEKASGKLATFKNYIRGKEAESGPLLVLGNKEYTIVSYSINSKVNYPQAIENDANISSATISNTQVEFMFQKQDIKIASKSNNTIKINLKHQFAQITTIIKLDNATKAYASIRGANGASYFKPSYSNTKFKVADNTITAINSDLNDLGSTVIFPFIPFDNLQTYTITSTQPTILNTPTAIKNGTFTIEALTIGDVSRRVDINNLNLTPGVKYNLVLTFNVPETTIIGANPYFKFYDVTTKDIPFYHTVDLENPTFGAQIDIWYLDNSFNLNINGQNLFSKELNFEGFPLHDVYFTDNTYYGMANSGINVIYRINEIPPRLQIPVVRLTIDEDGNIKLFGRKNMTQGLRELRIRNTVTINPLAKLKPNGMNKLIFSSTRWTTTDVEGRVYGIRIKTP